MGPIQRLRLWWQVRSGGSDAPLDSDAPAWLISLLIHLLVLVTLTIITSKSLKSQPDFIVDSSPINLDEDDILPEEFQHSDEQAEDVGALALAGVAEAAAEAPIEDTFSDIAQDDVMPVVADNHAIMALAEPVAVSPTVSNRLIKGVGAVGVTGAAGAIDRITHEIMLSMEQRPTMIVWLFDRSASLAQQREFIHERIDRIYHELGVIQKSGKRSLSTKDKPLLTSVIQFAEHADFLLQKPTDDLDLIKKAIEEVQTDSTGKENVFQAIYTAADKYRKFRTMTTGKRNVILIVFTDEVGDDTERLDVTVDLCRRFEMPVHVVGVPAPFGRRKALVKYVDPDPNFDQTPQFVPIDQGPESLMPERVQIGFSGSGEMDNPIDSGFGPFSLTRLCYQTGGIYFASHPNRQEDKRRVTRRQTSSMTTYLSRFFDPKVMRHYRPDYVSVNEYKNLLSKNRARAALVQASMLSWTTQMENIRTFFPKQDEARLATLLTRAQRTAAILEPKVRRIYQTLKVGESARPELEKLRWQAGYDLAMGRTLAVKVRTEAYNAMLAKAKQGMKFKDEKNDTWVLVPSDEVSVGSTLEKEAKKASMYLERVVEDHADTPWAYLAQQELQTPLGWKWTERFTGVNAPRVRTGNGNANPRNDKKKMLAPRKPKRAVPNL